MTYRSVIFDFDGTIADTLDEARKVYNHLALEYALRQVGAEEVPDLRHFSLKELLSHLGIPKHRVPILLVRATSLLRANIGRIPLIPGMATLLPALRDRAHCFGILTSNTASNVELFLDAHSLTELFRFVSSTSKLSGKAKHLRAIQKTFSIRGEEILYVGDEIRDIRAAKKAGVAMAAVTWGFNSRASLEREEPDYLIDSPAQLLDLVAPSSTTAV